MIWTDEAIQILSDDWALGKPDAEIARRLGTTRMAIRGKVGRLGLEKRMPGMVENRIRRQEMARDLLKQGRTTTSIAAELHMDAKKIREIRLQLEMVFPQPAPVAGAEPLPPKPLPVSIVPFPTLPMSRVKGCLFPLWAHGDKPKFRADGNPMTCDAPVAGGVYCREHRAVCYTRVAEREAA